MLRRAGPGIAWRSSVPRDVLGHSRPILGTVAGDLDAAMDSPNAAARTWVERGGRRHRAWCDDGGMTENAPASDSGGPTAQDEVAALASELIRIDTTNPGDHSGPGERAAAERVAELLAEVGLEPTVLESHPKRASVVVRIEGEDRVRPALLIHGHLDVVPADPADWRVHPFSGEIADGCVWGRGAVDMKDMDAMMLAVIRQRLREGRRPPRDVVLAFLADEEAGGKWGARWLVDNHPELFEGVTEAIGEVGGFSATIGGRRLYLIQTAEKGIAWMRLTARGTAGHGSMLQPDNAVTELAEAVARIGRHEWPVRLTPAAQGFLDEAAAALGVEVADGDYRDLIAKLGPIARLAGATVTNTTNPSVLSAGYKVNVVPQVATAQVDGRFLPGGEDEFFAEVDEPAWPGRRARVHAPRHRRADDARWRPRRRDGRRAARARIRRGRSCRTAFLRGRTRSRSAASASGASGSARCGCLPILTSPACSTAWTSGFRSTRCSSAFVSWINFSIFASPLSQVRAL